MPFRTIVPLVILSACSGEDTTPTDPIECDSIVAEPLGQVGTYDWPPGVREALDLYPTLSGVYTADNSCGDDVTVKLTHPPEDLLEIVLEPWPDVSGLACGCTVDPKYPSDPALELVMLHYDFEVYVDDFGDPGIDDVTIVTEGAFYVPAQPLEFRSCANTNVDPLVGSLYSSMSYVVRIPADGALELDIVLFDESGGSLVCELTDFTPAF